MTQSLRPALTAARAKFGFLPPALARMAESPALVRSFTQAIAAFDHSSLSPLEREAAVLVVARDFACHVCITIHAGVLAQLGSPELARVILAGAATGDARIDAIVAFTTELIRTRGDVGARVWTEFLTAGYTREQALELVLGIGAYTMSTFANRLTAAPLALDA